MDKEHKNAERGTPAGTDRFRPIRRVLPVLRSLRAGKRVGVEEVTSLTGLDVQHARRLLSFLQRELKLVREYEGHRIVVYEEVQASLGAPDLVGMVALEAACATMDQFRGSDLHRRWQELAARAVEAARGPARELHERLAGAIYVVQGAHADMSKVQAAFDACVDAVTSRNRVAFDYGSAAGRGVAPRRVEPWTVALHLGIPYLVAPEEGAEQPKLWRLDRMQGCHRIRGTTYDYPSRYRYSPAAYFQDSFGVWKDDGAAEEVVLRVSGELEEYVAGTIWHSSEEKHKLTNGIEVSLRVTITPEFERWLLSLGEGLTVVSPTALSVRLAERHEQAAVRLRPRT